MPVVDRALGQRSRARREQRRQHLTAHGVAWPQLLGGLDPPARFSPGQAHPSGQHIGPGLAPDLMGGRPVHQHRQDPVIDRRIGAGALVAFGLQRQQLGGVEHREIGIQQCFDRRGAIGEGMLHRLPTGHHIRSHDSNIRTTTDTTHHNVTPETDETKEKSETNPAVSGSL